MTEIRFTQADALDIIAIERHARALRAQAMAEALSGAARSLRAGLAALPRLLRALRSPEGRAA